MRSRQAGSELGGLADWEALGSDRFHVLGLGVKHVLMGDKLELGADLSFTRTKADLTLSQGVGPSAFPMNEAKQDTLKIHARYKLDDSLWLIGSLWHERHDSSDWRLDGVYPGTVQNLLSLGQQSPDYRVNVVSVSLRYSF